MIAWWCATGSFWLAVGLLGVLATVEARRAARSARQLHTTTGQRIPITRRRRAQPISPRESEERTKTGALTH